MHRFLWKEGTLPSRPKRVHCCWAGSLRGCRAARSLPSRPPKMVNRRYAGSLRVCSAARRRRRGNWAHVHLGKYLCGGTHRSLYPLAFFSRKLLALDESTEVVSCNFFPSQLVHRSAPKNAHELFLFHQWRRLVDSCLGNKEVLQHRVALHHDGSPLHIDMKRSPSHSIHISIPLQIGCHLSVPLLLEHIHCFFVELAAIVGDAARAPRQRPEAMHTTNIIALVGLIWSTNRLPMERRYALCACKRRC